MLGRLPEFAAASNTQYSGNHEGEAGKVDIPTISDTVTTMSAGMVLHGALLEGFWTFNLGPAGSACGV